MQGGGALFAEAVMQEPEEREAEQHQAEVKQPEQVQEPLWQVLVEQSPSFSFYLVVLHWLSCVVASFYHSGFSNSSLLCA